MKLTASFALTILSLAGGALPLTTYSQTHTILGDVEPLGSFLYAFDITAGYTFTPSHSIQVTAVRSFSGDKVSIWSDAGVRLLEQPVSGPGWAWTTVPLATPITLSPNTTYYLSDHFTGWVGVNYAYAWPATFDHGTVGQDLYFSGYDAFPIGLYSPYSSNGGPLVDLSYVVVPEPSILAILVCGLVGLRLRLGRA